ncbi:MAG: hypothetical protein V3R99_11875 [Thermoguttaceae bacterium]
MTITDNKPPTPRPFPTKFLLGLFAAYLVVISLGGCGSKDRQNPRLG